MKKFKAVLSMILTGALAVSLLAACATQPTQPADTQAETSAEAETSENENAETTDAETEEVAGIQTTDPEGNPIVLPEKIDAIVSMAPSTTQFLIDLGLGDKIVACDSYSAFDYADDLPADVQIFDMMTPDNEAIVALAPDIMFTTGMSSAGGADVFASVREAGVCVANIPSETTIAEIMTNLLFIGTAVGKPDEAQMIVDDMDAMIEEIVAIGESIPEDERKTVFYEFSTPTSDYPMIYTCSSQTYISEMLRDIGAINIADEQNDAWITYTEEEAVAANPDVILTTDTYTENVIDVILTMEGWENVAAIVNKEVYQPDANAVNRPNQHIVGAMIEMGKMIYPEYFEELENPYADEEELDLAA